MPPSSRSDYSPRFRRVAMRSFGCARLGFALERPHVPLQAVPHFLQRDILRAQSITFPSDVADVYFEMSDVLLELAPSRGIGLLQPLSFHVPRSVRLAGFLCKSSICLRSSPFSCSGLKVGRANHDGLTFGEHRTTPVPVGKWS
jgi:hypothetical protein